MFWHPRQIIAHVFEILAPRWPRIEAPKAKWPQKSAAGAPIWSSIGVVFLWFSLIVEVSKCIFFATCRQKGFKCFRGTFFHSPGSANIGKYSQNVVGSFKNKGWEPDNILQPGVARVVPKWHFLLHFRASLATNSTKKTPKKHAWKQAFFWRLQNAVPEATPTYAHFRTITGCQATPVQ